MVLKFSYYANGITNEPSGYMAVYLDKVLSGERMFNINLKPMTMVQFKGVLKVLKTLAADGEREEQREKLEAWLAGKRTDERIAKDKKMSRRLDGMAKAYEEVFGKHA
jgi:hypothetical protein